MDTRGWAELLRPIPEMVEMGRAVDEVFAVRWIVEEGDVADDDDCQAAP